MNRLRYDESEMFFPSLRKILRKLPAHVQAHPPNLQKLRDAVKALHGTFANVGGFYDYRVNEIGLTITIQRGQIQ